MKNMDDNGSWWELYRTAMVEIDLSKLQTRIDTAREAIIRCMEQQSLDSRADRQAMVDALENLRVLQKIEIMPLIKRGVEGDRVHGREATP